MTTETTYIQILNRLRDQMREREISPTQLAELSGRNISQVSRWLNNKVEMTIPTLLMVCEALDLDPAVLFILPAEKRKRNA